MLILTSLTIPEIQTGFRLKIVFLFYNHRRVALRKICFGVQAEGIIFMVFVQYETTADCFFLI